MQTCETAQTCDIYKLAWGLYETWHTTILLNRDTLRVLKWWFPNSEMSSLSNHFKNGKLNVCLIILQIFTHNWSNMYVPGLHNLGKPCKQNPGLGISGALYVVHFPLFLWVLYIRWSYMILTPFSDHWIFVTREVYKKKSGCMYHSEEGRTTLHS